MIRAAPAAELAAAVLGVLADRSEPVVVGLDGRSGAGKSTLAGAVAEELDAAGRPTLVIEGDDFYAGGSAATWDRRSAREKAEQVIDWQRQRRVLLDLRGTGAAQWHPFDWDAPDWDANVVPMSDRPVRAEAGSVVVLEGAYSCRPELHDLLDLRVLLDVPADIRYRRLGERDGENDHRDWNARWAAAENHYFGTVMTPGRFDLVVIA